MPSHRIHRLLDKLVFGKEYGRLHSFKDAPAQWAGPRHRKYFHDPVSDAAIALITYPEDPVRALASSIIHDLLDSATTELKRRNRALRRHAV